MRINYQRAVGLRFNDASNNKYCRYSESNAIALFPYELFSRES